MRIISPASPAAVRIGPKQFTMKNSRSILLLVALAFAGWQTHANAQATVNLGSAADFAVLAEQCNGGKKKYGGITDFDEMRANLRTSCVPESLLEGEVPSYDDFLEQRRKLMAAKMKHWFNGL